jgi:hypothetical protein
VIAAAIFTASSLVLGAAALYAHGPWLRAVAYAILVASNAALWYTALGVPRPVLISAPKGNVVAYLMDEPRSIYMWVVRPGEEKPIAYRIPWREQTAVQLSTAMGKARRQGRKLRVGPGTSNNGGAPKFKLGHAPALPPKAPK